MTWTFGRLGRPYLSGQAARTPGGAFDDADAELRRLIREGFKHGIPGEQLAQAAGLSLPRVYQIRDGRR